MQRLTPELVLAAYREGVFPMWDTEHGRLLWFQPDPRAILLPCELHLSRSLRRTMRRGSFDITFDTDFTLVMEGCADRPEGTWISDEFIVVYSALHLAGHAHSVECWHGGRLVGGAYGIAIGGAFMAESMFHRETDASKVALAALVERLSAHGFTLIDVQFITQHLASLGAREVPHLTYMEMLRNAMERPGVAPL